MEEFELPDGSYSVSDIQDHFEYIIKTYETVTDKTGYYLQLLTHETMKLLAGTKSKITKDKNGESVPHLEITKVVLIHCNIVKNNYQQDSRVLYTFVPNKSIIKYFTKKFYIFKNL